MAPLVTRDARGRRVPNVTALLQIGVVVTLCVIALGAVLQQPRRIFTMAAGSRVVATVDFCTATTVSGGDALAEQTSCVGSWRMPDGRRGSGPLDGVGAIRSFDGNVPPDPPYPAASLEGSEVHVYATTSRAVRPNPGIVVAAGSWLLACLGLFLLLGLQILRRARRRTG
jgi:hypothetical protein